MDLTMNRTVPWFCPNCRRRGTDLPASELCAHCGTRVEFQGYCPVCEDFQPLAVGALCPKHEIELEAEAPSQAQVAEHGPWVELGRFPDATACQGLRIRLEAEGIPTVLEGERVGSRSMYSVAVGGVSLNVPEGLLAESRIIQSQTWSKDAAELGVEEEDWDEDGLDAPDGDRGNWAHGSARAYLMVELAMFAGFVLFMLAVVLSRFGSG